MKIALIGASGFVGTALLKEAASRGHSVTAIVRRPDKVEAGPNVTAIKADVNDTETLASILPGHDVAISAFNGGWGDPDIYSKHLQGSRSIAKASRSAGIRLIMIGGAGSLYAADGTQFVDSPQFPTEWKDGAKAARDALGELRKETELDWTFVSPPFELVPGQRTGRYRVSDETPVFDEAGKSTVSVADLAVAVLDEAEQPKHRRARFTVGY